MISGSSHCSGASIQQNRNRFGGFSISENIMYTILMKAPKGFTLIELLVVIAIIALLSSVVLATLSSARMKGRDAKRISDFQNVHTAMELFYDQFGYYPGDNALFDNQPSGHRAQFEAMAQQLVNAKLLSYVPKDPTNIAIPGSTASSSVYMYFNYGTSTPAGALIVVNLESIAPTLEGPYNSCRPFTNNWCSTTIPNKALCYCHPY
jgi:prepilin-type N-terminal cleavage/methylation domain-containing protein